MPSKIFLFLLLFTAGLHAQELPLIPKPAKIELRDETFQLDDKTVIESPRSFEAEYLQQAILAQTGLRLKIVGTAAAHAIRLRSRAADVQAGDEDYWLQVGKEDIKILAPKQAGIFYGIQTLLQAIPNQHGDRFQIQGLSVSDHPKYQWRGMHLDVARHFFPISFVKKYIDHLTMYKMNTFHWHLTDDQGWRIEIKKYPKLTEVGGWRKGSMVGHYSDHKYDTIRYGGFYTQAEIKEVIDYASQRHVTIVPEIEMPGHARAALAAYPELSCTGGPFETALDWGILEDVFCPKEITFDFLEDVLTEVIALFPSPYIHIGGDECPKVRWKSCPHCQKLIKDQNLKDEHELQSYFITRIEKFVNSKGRQIIGWDEILEGGLAPNAAVMSWRGTKGGITAAKQKHFVVMSPGSHCYFDAYQGDPQYEPVAIGGFLPVEKVYSYNPTPDGLTADEAKYILGAQANLWTEYIATPAHAEYMVMPRMAALAEALWGTSTPDQFGAFRKRLIDHFKVYEAKGISYAKNIYDLSTTVAALPTKDGIALAIGSVSGNGIHFTTDGSVPTAKSPLYTAPVEIKKPVKLTAAYFENGVMKGNPMVRELDISKTSGKNITLANQPHSNYNSGGAFTLVDGLTGNPKRYGQNWLGFNGTDLSAVIDFPAPQTLSAIRMNFLESPGSWIYFPGSVEVYSGNTLLAGVTAEAIRSQNGRISVAVPTSEVTQLKVVAKNAGMIPDGKPGAGSKAWLFIDEISAD